VDREPERGTCAGIEQTGQVRAGARSVSEDLRGRTRLGHSPSPGLSLSANMCILGLLLLFAVDSYATPVFRRTEANTVEFGSTFVFLEAEVPGSVLWGTRLAFVLVAGAGVVGLLQGSLLHIPVAFRFIYLALFLWSSLLVLTQDLPPARLFASNALVYGKLSPGVVTAMSVTFLAANPALWPVFLRSLRWFAAVASAFCLVGLTQVQDFSRIQAYRWVFEPGLVLEATALIAFAAIHGRHSRAAKAAACIPLALLAVVTILEQARLLLVVLACMFVAYVFIRKPAKANTMAMGRRQLLVLTTFGLFTLLGLLLLYQNLSQSDPENQLYRRLTEDTRTAQFHRYFEALDWDTVFLGNGHVATEEPWFGGGGAEAIDCGYLNLLWVGGALLVLLFLAFAVSPATRCLFRRLDYPDAAVVALAVMYFVRLASSTNPGFNTQFMIVCLLVGRCIYLVSTRSPTNIERRWIIRPRTSTNDLPVPA
jgi:hypothetical protein